MIRTFDPQLNWSSSKDNLIDSFYKPALSDCSLYQRLSGYFSSTSFANVINEMLEFVENRGRIELITSPKFSESDKKIFEASVANTEWILSKIFLDDLKNDPDNLKIHFAKLMAYMLTSKIDGKPQLEIKIAVPNNGEGIYHQKVGILHYGRGKKISFSGSVNETASGWGKNVENFKVFCSWRGSMTHTEAIKHDQKTFDDFWNNDDSETSVYGLPSAVKMKLLQIRPESTKEFQDTIDKAREIIRKTKKKTTIELFDYQKNAISAWAENNFMGLLAMATGTGKTFAAFGCIHKAQSLNKRTVTIIACPQKHLVEQWNDEIKNYYLGVAKEKRIIIKTSVICHSDHHSWEKRLEQILNNFNIPLLGTNEYVTNHFIIFTTHDTLKSNNFRKKIAKIHNAKIFLIVDEVHNITPRSAPNTLLDTYDIRLGLSATPLRHYDHEGSQIILDYFGGVVFMLDLKDAIKKHILSEYDYIPHYVTLNSDEMSEYKNLTAQIARKMQVTQIARKKAAQKHHDEEDVSNVEIKRADLISNAENKYIVLKEVLGDLDNQLSQTLIYCTNNPSPIAPLDSPRQLERVKEILTNRKIVSDSVTWEDPTADRLKILDNLANEHFDCVTAVKCLDEGVNIPSVRTAIFMASSGNPKQYIQRRGRVLRRGDKTGKTHATIYDILVAPPMPDPNTESSKSDRKMVAKELLRHKEFARIARNKIDAINKIREVAMTFNIDLDALDDDYIINMV